MQQSGEDISLTGSSSTDMPDVIGKVKTLDPRNFNSNCPNTNNNTLGATGCYFLPPTPAFAGNTTPCVPSVGAFVQNCALGTFGTANRRFFHGPGINNFDMGVSKRLPITEAKAFEFRVEFFNIFNHAQFLNPSGDIDGNMGVVTSARDPRIGQLSAKFIW